MNRRLLDASRDRLRRLRRALRERHLAAYLATSPVEVAYLSNFGGDDAYLWVPSRGKAVLLTDFRYAEDAAQDCPHVRAVRRKDSLSAEVASLASDLDGPLAFDPRDLSVAGRRALARQLRAGRGRAPRRRRGTPGPTALKQLPGLVTRMRAAKDDVEVTAIRRALRIAETAYADFLRRIRLGMTETRLAAKLEYCLRCHGADGPAFPTICAVGPNASRPHARPGNRRLSALTPLLVDFGALVRGYRCDLTRMVFPPRIPPGVRRAYEAVLAAQAAAIAVAGPGVRAVDVDAAARKFLESEGYGKAFGHGTGHGIGREVHEAPGVSPKSGKQVLVPGMVITVEPGVYLPGRFGIRVEDDVLITGKGRRVLSRLPKRFDAVRLTGRR